jgi:regulator of protease activity HflC (stomatin/prohibitin superfamily)
MFPISEREWDATGQEGSDSGRFKAFTKDSVEMYVPVTVRFTLITECKTLKDFYVKYARRYQVEFKDDGSYNQAWITVLRKLIADPTDQTLDRIVQDYNWRDVWNNPKIKPEIERRLDEALSSKDSLLVQTAHKAYFENISVLVGKARPVQKELADAVALEQTNVAKAQSAEAQARAETAKATAQLATQRAEANKTKADIGAFPTVEAYNINLCIRTSGCNPYPSPIIPGVAR